VTASRHWSLTSSSFLSPPSVLGYLAKWFTPEAVPPSPLDPDRRWQRVATGASPRAIKPLGALPRNPSSSQTTSFPLSPSLSPTPSQRARRS
jgi:hypothetical protein